MPRVNPATLWKAAHLEEELERARERAANAEELLQRVRDENEEYLRQVQDELQAREDEVQDEIENGREEEERLLEEFHVARDNLRCEREEEDDNESNGSETDENVQVDEEHQQWMDQILKVTKLMQQGRVAMACKEDCKAAEICMELLPPIVFPRGRVARRMREPSGGKILSENVVERSLEWVKTHEWSTRSLSLTEALANCGGNFGKHSELPDDVDSTVVMMVREVRAELASQEIKDATLDDDDNNNDNNNNFDFVDVPELSFTAAAWTAISETVHSKVKEENAIRERARQGVREDSAKIAIFNHKAHFLWQTEEGMQSEPTLDNALRGCQLRERPVEWFSSSDGEKKALPFEIPMHQCIHLDLEGDMLASCGETSWAGRGYVGSFGVPVPSSLDTAPNLAKVCHRHPCLYDSNPTRHLFLHSKRDGPVHYNTVLAECDAARGTSRVWAADTVSCAVHGFDTRSRRKVAHLAFPKTVQRVSAQFFCSRFGLARCGEVLLATGGDSSLHAWRLPEVVAAFAAQGGDSRPPPPETVFDSDDDDMCDSEEDDTDPYTGAADTLVPSTPSLPTVSIELGHGWSAGDVQSLSDSMVVVASAAGDLPENALHYSSMRVVDVGAERVVSVLAGHFEAPSLQRQYCVAAHQLLFSMEAETGRALVFDIRTASPAFAIPNCAGSCLDALSVEGACAGILGVPTATGAVAFTWSKDECIRAWDLRKPASHLYTMSTGNLTVQDMVWHEASASLLASTRNTHQVWLSRSGFPMRYGEPLDEDDEDEEMHSGWPARTVREADYFPERYNVAGSDPQGYCLLQYAFKNGSAMHEPLPPGEVAKRACAGKRSRDSS